MKRAVLLAALLGAAAVGAVMLLRPAIAEGSRPVRSLLEMRRENVVIQKWDLSCGAAALDILLRYEHGDPVTEREIARGLIGRAEYMAHPELVRKREGFSLFDLKRYAEKRGYRGIGFGKLQLDDLIQHAPLMVPVDALGYHHFVIFRGVMGNRVLLADPAWGNRTMTRDKFERMWINYGETVGHVGFVIERVDEQKSPNRLKPKPEELVMYY